MNVPIKKLSQEVIDLILYGDKEKKYKININPNTEKQLCEQDILKILYEYVNNTKIKTTQKNKGFTQSYVKSIKQFHKEHWTILKSRLLTAKN